MATENKTSKSCVTLHPKLCCKLHNYVEELVERRMESLDETKHRLETYYTGSEDYFTVFEKLTVQGLICVKAYDIFEANVMFCILHCIIDDTDAGVIDSDINPDKPLSLSELENRKEVFVNKPEVFGESLGNRLAEVMKVDTAPIVWNLMKLKDLTLRIKKERCVEDKASETEKQSSASTIKS